jgi:LmbE family N-acetylglucosaminyl deacetylase
MGEQLQKINPAVVRWAIQWRSRRQTMNPSPEPMIVFSPHKDDEVLGCGGMIIKKRRLGAQVYIVFMTDGCASHKSRFITPSELARLRTSEARRCAQTMGVPNENLIFLEFEERCLGQREAEAQRRVAKILRDLRPAEVFVPYHREAQTDHGETNRIVRNALGEMQARHFPPVNFYEYFVWTMRLWFWQINELYHAGAWCKLDVRDIQRVKINALAQYKSQTTVLFPGERWPVLPQDLRRWFSQPCEYFLKSS